MHENLIMLMEWSTWAILDAESNMELVLLKGHLIIGDLLSCFLSENGIETSKNETFSKKVRLLQRVPNAKEKGVKELVPFLVQLNRLRNKLAHERSFKIYESEVENWAASILSSYTVRKFTRFTRRTRVVHAFSALANEIGDATSRLKRMSMGIREGC